MARQRLEIGEIGEISITPHEDRFMARCKYRDQSGRIRNAKAIRPSKEAARKACRTTAKDKAEEGNSEIRPSSPLRLLVASWWEVEKSRVEAGRITEDTLTSYQRTRDMILDGLGDLKIREATAVRMGAFIKARGGKHHTVHRDLKRLLSAIFDHAMALDIMTSNPARAVPLHAAPPKEIVAYDEVEVQELRAAVRAYEAGGANRITEGGKRAGGRPRETYLADFVDLMLSTGCRISEMLGLRWEDIDLAGSPATLTVVGIVKTRKADPGKGLGYLYWRPRGKTKSSWRTISLGAAAVEVLLRLHVANDDGHRYVFSTGEGGLRSPHNVRNALRVACDEAGSGLSGSKTHTLRKTVATLVEESDGIRSASLLLGHRTQATTEKHYVARPDLAPDSSARLDRLLLVEPE